MWIWIECRGGCFLLYRNLKTIRELFRIIACIMHRVPAFIFTSSHILDNNNLINRTRRKIKKLLKLLRENSIKHPQKYSVYIQRIHKAIFFLVVSIYVNVIGKKIVIKCSIQRAQLWDLFNCMWSHGEANDANIIVKLNVWWNT